MEPELQILGVDFSGAKTDDRTWVAQGALSAGILALHDCAPMGRAKLSETLSSLPGGSVAALDFPFSVPESFARFWQPEAVNMPDLWAAAAAMELGQFLVLRDRFVARCGEPKRRGDLNFPECYSCLHQANPNMVPMTFYGMRMLDSLWRAGCSVPPLESHVESHMESHMDSPLESPGKSDGEPDRDSTGGNRPVLLEAMPGAALKALQLPHKGYKNGANAHRLRQRILEGLEARSGVEIENLDRYRDLCLESHDCLDAVVAAVAASLWAAGPSVFLRPCVAGPNAPDRVALLEGWLYAPTSLGRSGP